uniref:Zinc finger, CCHC-type n=1 Tax=Tanacetum cinerariifolium TaxID=118510 RepID=A0A699GTV2_TANCI|nr:zinc finger, CCHC-type [Tanacetum cinerariifolium]
MISDAFDPRVSPNENLLWILYYADGIIGVKYGMHKVPWWNVEEDDKSLCLLRAMPTQSEEYPSGNRVMESVLHEEYMFAIHSNDEKHRETNMSSLLHAMRHDEMGQIKSEPSEYYFHVMHDFSKLPRLAIPSEWYRKTCSVSFPFHVSYKLQNPQAIRIGLGGRDAADQETDDPFQGYAFEIFLPERLFNVQDAKQHKTRAGGYLLFGLQGSRQQIYWRSVAQRRLQDKQLKEKTITDYLRSTQQCMKSEVAKHLSVVGIQQQNRLVYETNVTLFAKVRRFLIQSGLSKVFWAKDTTRSTYLVNRSPSLAIGFKKPIDMLDFLVGLQELSKGCLNWLRNMGFSESEEYKKTSIGYGVGTGSMLVLHGFEFEVEPLGDHTFEVEPQENVDQGAGLQEVQTQDLMDYQLAIAQRRLQDKQPKEKTITDCLRSTQQCMKSGVAKHLGVVGIQQQNRLVYETNVTLCAKVRCFLIQSGLSKVFWAKDTTRSTYLVNRSLSLAIGFKKPIDMLEFFGWLASIKQGMLEPVKVKCIFLGYHKSIVGNKLWRLNDVTSKFEVEPLGDHTFEMEPQENVDQGAGLQEVQTQDLMDYQLARDSEQHIACELFEYREDSNKAAFSVAAVKKIYAHKSLTFNNTVACEVISKWKAKLKDDMDARSDVYVLSNGFRKCSDDSDGYYWGYTRLCWGDTPYCRWRVSLSGDCDVENNGKWSCIYAVGSQEYQMVCTRPDIASVNVGMLDGFDRGLQTYV